MGGDTQKKTIIMLDYDCLIMTAIIIVNGAPLLLLMGEI